MSFLKFLLLCAITYIGTAISHIIIRRFDLDREDKKSLAEMFLSGELKTDKSVSEQVREMSFEIESCEIVDDMTTVDIERAKERLREKNERLREIVLEIN